ncbi:sigma-70 family RNA polymerase sigma factor [Nocardioides sp. LMS-CY]|uniref:sigma-70 family RNA polymerase sigma factor n=1 Tax=Nocardioides sp. (strain LMS-CY) TaxID=2840457 RepID=UPI001C00877C|nr:sigma-70 family RNA polymerase sigma factor [Nocardioides sp. LMS-CY]QWF20448.1 sigma-70 family RNA polymerase sigma factor [Nocardioides sp. LMS-CY]
MSTPERRAGNAALTAQLQQAANEDRDDIIDALVLANLDIARSVARRYTGRSGFGADLEQVAALALVRAVHDFDPERGHEFLTYAIPCVTGAVKHYFRDSAWVVRPPRDVQQRHLVDDGTAEHVDDGVQVESCFRPWSLDAPMPGDDTPLGAMLADERDRPWEHADDRTWCWQHLRSLPPRAQRIIQLRFFEDRTQQEIADELGVSQVHVSRLLSRHLAELREQMVEAA